MLRVPRLLQQFPLCKYGFFLTGLVLGGAGSLVAITPLGRLSGAHLNPAISLGFFTLGGMQLQDLLGYIVAQTAGASLGACAGQVAFGRLASRVRDALNQPGKLVDAHTATAAEAVATFALAAMIFSMVSRRSLARWTPLVVVGVVAIIVWLDGNFSRASLNPARSFGPALITGDWHLFWIYAVGPCSGVRQRLLPTIAVSRTLELSSAMVAVLFTIPPNTAPI